MEKEDKQLLYKLGFKVLATLVKKKNSEVMVAKVIKEKDFNINKWNLIQEITKDDQNPFLLKYESVQTYGEYAIIFAEYSNKKSIKNLIDTKKKLPIHVVRAIMRQLLEGIRLMDEKGLTHGNINEHNILLDSPPGSGRVYLNIAGFDFNTQQQVNQLGTAPDNKQQTYKAPEIQIENEHVWSAGILFFKLLTNEYPSGQLSIKEDNQFITSRRIVRPDSIKDDTIWSILTQMLEYQSKDRITASEALQSPFFTGEQALTEVSRQAQNFAKMEQKAKEDGKEDVSKYDLDPLFIIPNSQIKEDKLEFTNLIYYSLKRFFFKEFPPVTVLFLLSVITILFIKHNNPDLDTSYNPHNALILLKQIWNTFSFKKALTSFIQMDYLRDIIKAKFIAFSKMIQYKQRDNTQQENQKGFINQLRVLDQQLKDLKKQNARDNNDYNRDQIEHLTNELKNLLKEIAEKTPDRQEPAQDQIQSVMSKLLPTGLDNIAFKDSGASILAHSIGFNHTQLDPMIVLEGSDIDLGECFPLMVEKVKKGKELKMKTQYITIEFAHDHQITAVTISHVPAYLTETFTSAPRDFSVTCINDVPKKPLQLKTKKEELVIVEDTFDPELLPHQTFEAVTIEGKEEYRSCEAIRFDFFSNYGNEDFTCVYRLQVHSTNSDKNA
ncbi:MAG: hypothetical protein EZS28_005728 [Streblomastix strix]|uniref:Protein kinase domain-containing protein n=1 Tax=Streblomastix strix TaxID=222440 RepID=A0A5J4WUP2_9EUKA|nr:MAG: hypothetical protein EZS28_005728 [Streblomastix strix]